MRLTIAAVGRLKAGAEKSLFEDYAGRIAWPLVLREVEERRTLSAAEREKISAVSMIRAKGLTVDDRVWTPAHARLLKRAASYPEVERILVHPGIKKKLCDTVTGDRRWLGTIRAGWCLRSLPRPHGSTVGVPSRRSGTSSSPPLDDDGSSRR